MTNEPCPLCKHAESNHFHTDKNRQYLRCPHCELIFVAALQLPSPSAEKDQYDLHNNSPDDPHYRAFLNRLVTPLTQLIKPASYGLDFGCGPGPAIATMLKEQGHKVDNFDPFYAPDLDWQQCRYDFICCTEVIEHIHWPTQTLDDLWACLKLGGVFGIMTKRASSLAHFENWHYKNDPSHVRFYGEATFQYLAERWQAKLELVAKDVAFFKKTR